MSMNICGRYLSREAVVEAAGFEVVATADRIMANAAKALGVKVQGFFTTGPAS